MIKIDLKLQATSGREIIVKKIIGFVFLPTETVKKYISYLNVLKIENRISFLEIL